MNWLGRLVAARRWTYWAWVLLLTVAGTFIGHHASGAGVFIDLRYWLHQRITNLDPRIDVRHTAVVTVDDDDYWLGELAARRPIKRDYLARLLRAVDRANPSVIALDFDLSSPDPAAPLIQREYERETRELADTVRALAVHRAIVLPRTIGLDAAGRYVIEADVHDPWGLCPRTAAERSPGKVSCGYIALSPDVRLLPPRLQMADGMALDSLAVAMARARLPLGSGDDRPVALTYGSFVPVARYHEQFAVMSAGELMARGDSAQKLAHRVVLIGAAWSRLAHRRGPVIDGHATPVGVIPGVFIHANYAEAIIDGRAYRPIPEGVGLAAEVALVLVAAVVFATPLPPWRKTAAVALLGVCLVAFSYLLFQNLGRFFDAFIPLVMVAGHAVLEQVREWRHEAHAARAERGRTGERP